MDDGTEREMRYASYQASFLLGWDVHRHKMIPTGDVIRWYFDKGVPSSEAVQREELRTQTNNTIIKLAMGARAPPTSG